MQDHVKCHFVRPAVDSVSGGGREEVAGTQENLTNFPGVTTRGALHSERGRGAERGRDALADPEQPGAPAHRPGHDDDPRLRGPLRPGL